MEQIQGHIDNEKMANEKTSDSDAILRYKEALASLEGELIKVKI
jgi:hypothetical protein